MIKNAVITDLNRLDIEKLIDFIDENTHNAIKKHIYELYFQGLPSIEIQKNTLIREFPQHDFSKLERHIIEIIINIMLYGEFINNEYLLSACYFLAYGDTFKKDLSDFYEKLKQKIMHLDIIENNVNFKKLLDQEKFKKINNTLNKTPDDIFHIIDVNSQHKNKYSACGFIISFCSEFIKKELYKPLRTKINKQKIFKYVFSYLTLNLNISEIQNLMSIDFNKELYYFYYMHDVLLGVLFDGEIEYDNLKTILKKSKEIKQFHVFMGFPPL